MAASDIAIRNNHDGTFDLVAAHDGMEFGAPSFASRRDADLYLADFGRELAAMAASWRAPSRMCLCGGS